MSNFEFFDFNDYKKKKKKKKKNVFENFFRNFILINYCLKN